MATVIYPSSRARSERAIAVARVVLAITASFTFWLEPAQAAPEAEFIYGLYSAYAVYAVVLLVWSLWGEIGGHWPIVTHAVDVVLFTAFQYLTLGSTSPFFVFSLFSVFCGALRWGWQGTLATGAVVICAYVGMAGAIGASVSVPELQLKRFVTHLAYLVVATGLLVHLGRYEARLRLEIERLARWPSPLANDREASIGRILEYGATLMQAGCALVIWENNDEPQLHEARWTRSSIAVSKLPPSRLRITTDPELVNSTFLCTGSARTARSILLADHAGRLVRREGMPLPTQLLERLDGRGLATAAIRTDLISGRVFFSDLGTPAAEALPLTELVAREIASSLDQLQSAEQREELAAREERVRVARDLHDGVLQALTGVRLELRALSKAIPVSKESLEQKLVSIERALAMEQRELRFFIAGLEPGSAPRQAGTIGLAKRLDSVRERLSLEWQTPVTVRLSPQIVTIPESLEEAVPLMVHEAAVNALKHAQPSRVSVDVDYVDGHLRISVTDDGQGFPFKGTYSHETLAAAHVAPRSLFDRVSALGGQISIESSDRGSRVEMVVSL